MVAMLCAAVALSIGMAPAADADPLDYVVHTERVQVGPLPGDGRIHRVAPSGDAVAGFHIRAGRRNRRQVRHHHRRSPPTAGTDADRLSRHPRNRDVWGLDVQSLDSSGTWTLRFEIDGPQGEGTGDLTVDVLKQPGPPLALSWLVGLIPLTLTLVFLAVVWIRTGRRDHADTSA